ncbi:MAG TPA: RNA polymerase sigma factor [Patescibacteria group bacterium]|jgi:RNA polymerase sigma-70 factor (ECF subfamily)|nr:RNA polymerase sigma factor [Patescibacteria group bacterium]
MEQKSSDHFEEIVSVYSEPLFRFALNLTRSQSDAQDLTQHTFYVWAIKGHQLRDRSKVKAWLFTTLHRAFLAGQRRQTRFPQKDLEGLSDELPAHWPVVAERLDGSAVLAALSKVDERFQAPVALFYLEDYPYKEIATILDTPLGTIKSRIARGVAQLREILSDSSGSTSHQAMTSDAAPASQNTNSELHASLTGS